MRVRMLSPAPGNGTQYLTSFLVEDRVAIDAGCLGLYGEPGDQSSVRHVLLSHSHLDHLLSLPIFFENVLAGDDRPVTVHGSRETLETIRADIFNGRLWPALLNGDSSPYPQLEFRTLESERILSLDGLRITPVLVDHVVPTFGFIVDDGSSAVVFGSDSGPTRRIWEIARGIDHLRAVFLEASMPDELLRHADVCGHLTPSLLAAEVSKLPPGIEIIAVHLGARHRSRIVEELEALRLPGLQVGVGGRAYEF